MERLRKLWRELDRPHGAVWLPVLPPLGAFAELVVLFGAIFLAGFVFPEIDVFTREPSPFWLPILLLSLQYGTVAGLLAAGAATLAYALNGLAEQNVDEQHFAYLLRVWSLPILWIGVGLVLGQFRLRQIEIKQQLKSALAQRTTEAQALTKYVRNLERRCGELERYITSSASPSGGVVLDALADLADPATDVAQFLDRLRAAAFADGRLSVYVLQACALDMLCAVGPGDDEPSGRITSDHPIFRAVVGERQGVSVLDAAGEKILGHDGLAAVPIIQDDGGRVLGMLKLERASSTVLVETLTARLFVVASFLAPLMYEPRVVIDNTTERSSGSAAAQRHPRRRRYFSWLQSAGRETPTAGQDRSGSRPRAHS